MTIDAYILSFFGDDFTGSTDVMETLALQGLPTALFLDAPTTEELRKFELKRKVGGERLRAFGVAGITRSLPPDLMESELESVLKKLSDIPCAFFQYKICSTLDSSPSLGNIGVATDIALKYFPSKRIPLVVGAPFLHRFVAFGNLFARLQGKTYRIDRHPVMSVHPSTPMAEGDIGLHIAKQTKRKFQNIDLLAFDTSENLHLAYQQTAVDQFIIFDTIENQHLISIAQLVAQQRSAGPQLLIGSSGISFGLAQIYGAKKRAYPVGMPADQILVISGSCSAVTATQIKSFVQAGAESFSIDLIALLAHPESEYANVVTSVLASLSAKKSAVLYTALGPQDPMIERVSMRLSEHHRSLIGKHLGEIARRVIGKIGKIRTVVVGGDTSGQVSRALGIYALETAWPVAPGAPLCLAHSSDHLFDGLEISLKGGQNGQVDYFQRILSGQAASLAHS